MEELHIGTEIKAAFEKTGMTITKFSKRLNMSRENVYSIFNRQSIDTGLLVLISEVLEFDFFSLYVQRLNPEKDTEIGRLRNEIELLKQINELLKK
jgi:transcriptional regulator with XRE-family HTH domain